MGESAAALERGDKVGWMPREVCGEHGRIQGVSYVVPGLPERRIPINDPSAVPLRKRPCHQVPLALKTNHSTVLALLPGSLIPTYLDSEASLMADNLALLYNQRQAVTIDVLPDDILLEIFDFYVVRYEDIGLYTPSLTRRAMESWQSLVHVCRRWRGVVFGSPRRLDLRLNYDPGRSTRKTLDVWPAFPLLIQGNVSETSVDDVVAKLEHNDRICQINLRIRTTLQIEKLEKLWTTMQAPFPELVSLSLDCRKFSCVPVIPDSFLGGSAPNLFLLVLNSIPFPGLPRLPLTATRLACLHLRHIPHSGYISPEAMATCLTTLTGLEHFQLEFESPQSSPNEENRRSPPPTRSVVPFLDLFLFKGVNEYLEELVAWIDAPRLRKLDVTFFNDVDFDTPELIRFVGCSSILEALNEAYVFFEEIDVRVILRPQTFESSYQRFGLKILCRVPVWQLSSLTQICTTSLPLLSAMETLWLDIPEQVVSQFDSKDGIENIDWLELLLLFTAVKNLYLYKRIAQRLAPVLQEMTGGGTTEVFPALQNLYLEGFQSSESVEEGIQRFISARQLTNHPVAISVWDIPNKMSDDSGLDDLEWDDLEWDDSELDD